MANKKYIDFPDVATSLAPLITLLADPSTGALSKLTATELVSLFDTITTILPALKVIFTNEQFWAYVLDDGTMGNFFSLGGTTPDYQINWSFGDGGSNSTAGQFSLAGIKEQVNNAAGYSFLQHDINTFTIQKDNGTFGRFIYTIAQTIINSQKVTIENIQDYANNTAAITAGLTTGDLYRNGDILQIVH